MSDDYFKSDEAISVRDRAAMAFSAQWIGVLAAAISRGTPSEDIAQAAVRIGYVQADAFLAAARAPAAPADPPPPLDRIRAEARAYNDDLNAREVAPDGDSYNDLLDIVLQGTRS